MPKTPAQLNFLVVDDHEAVLSGTLSTLKQVYTTADIRTASTAQAAIAQISETLPDVVVMDLALPEFDGDSPKTETGLQLLRTLMSTYPELNLVVQSAHIRTLIQLKPAIDAHRGGFTIADKNLPMREMLRKVGIALDGGTFTPPEMRNGIEVSPVWLEVLRLAFQEGLQDKSIAERMFVSERTVRNYWLKVQNALNIYSEEGKNIRIQTEIRAREEGLLD
jgi:DNA-binding NarL/FixJ family response regulator